MNWLCALLVNFVLLTSCKSSSHAVKQEQTDIQTVRAASVTSTGRAVLSVPSWLLEQVLPVSKQEQLPRPRKYDCSQEQLPRPRKYNGKDSCDFVPILLLKDSSEVLISDSAHAIRNRRHEEHNVDNAHSYLNFRLVSLVVITFILISVLRLFWK